MDTGTELGRPVLEGAGDWQAVVVGWMQETLPE